MLADVSLDEKVAFMTNQLRLQSREKLTESVRSLLGDKGVELLEREFEMTVREAQKRLSRWNQNRPETKKTPDEMLDMSQPFRQEDNEVAPSPSDMEIASATADGCCDEKPCEKQDSVVLYAPPVDPHTGYVYMNCVRKQTSE